MLDFEGAAAECFGAVAVVFAFRVFLDRESVASLGLSFRGSWLRMLAVGAAIGAGMQTLVFITEFAAGAIRISAVAPLRVDVTAAVATLPLFAVAALAEEMPLRGYLFQNLRAAWGDRLALVSTSLIFALLHVANPGFHPSLALAIAGIALAGAWFCLSVIWTRSLWLALGAHIAWNLFEGPVFGFPVSGLFFGASTAITSVNRGLTWLTGGAFGPEAGLSSIFALAVGAAVLYVLHRRGIV